jgi:glycosyltransferase involved in cell wall biosynthesis
MLTKGKAKLILDFDDLEHAYWKNPFKIAFFRAAEKFFAKNFDYVATHNENLKKYISRKLGLKESKIIFLEQGVRTGMFLRQKTNLAERLGLKNNKVVMYAAHLGVAASDLDFVFEALKNLERSDVRLLIIGDGERFGYYKKMAEKMGIKDRVVFAGYVKHELMPEYMSVADAAINFMRDSPANRCRASIKIREYLAFGLPTACNIFGPDLENFRDYVYEFRAGDAKGFGNAIAFAIDDRSHKAGKAKKQMQKWDWDIIAKGFENELERLAK